MSMLSTEDEYKYRRVEQAITERIESGELHPGSKLPSLRQISSSLRVSISTVTHAYEEMECKGIIESRPRSGYYVRGEFRRIPTPSISVPATIEPSLVNKGTLIRTSLETVGNDDLLPLGVVCPGRELLPYKRLARIMNGVIRDYSDKMLDYQPIAGNLELRRQIAFRSIDCRSDISPDEIIITTGAMEALYIALRTLTRTGDMVLIQSPTYYCFLQLLETLGLRAVDIPACPEKGISPKDISHAIETFDIKACILSPNFNNPDGSLMPDENKQEIVSMLAKKEIPLVEDDVYGEIFFGSHRPRTFKSWDKTGGVILCSSFSKTIAPGYRIGWLSPGKFMDKAMDIKATTNVACVSPTQMTIAQYLREAHYDRHLRKLRKALKEQMELMRAAIGRNFPAGTKVSNPQGGSVLWVELPEGCDGVDIFFKAREKGIGIVPGTIFSPRDDYSRFIRISTGALWSEKIKAGIKTLGQLAAGKV